MIHAEPIVSNPITGKKAWLVRNIQGQYGDPFNWCVVLTRPYWGCREALLTGLVGKVSGPEHRALMAHLRGMGFRTANANRHGYWKTYNLE